MSTRKDIIYADLCFEIVGILYDVYDEIGFGHKEKYYQNALKAAFEEKNIKFSEQVYTPLKYNNQIIGKYFLDFLINDKVILEIKSGSVYSKNNINQIYSYLKANNLKLGILANFTKNGVKFKRIVNLK
ncbi:MAG: GxxExxY protein [Patescibacteria group bacterium]|nr:GxxExxY protein [Patescibacteria group bacterium]